MGSDLTQKISHRPPWWAALVNPSFILKRGLFEGICEHAGHLSGSILDFGAGSSPYRTLFTQATEYVTLDIEESGHPSEKKQADYLYDGKTMPFPDGRFDAVLASEVFEHVFNLDEILDELYRVLKPQGFLLATIPFVWEEHEAPYDFGRYTSYGLRHLLERHGFDVIAMRKVGSYISTIFQMAAVYWIRRPALVRRPILRRLMMPVVAPITLTGLLLERIFPRDERLFLDIVVLCRKGEHSRTGWAHGGAEAGRQLSVG